MKRNKIIFSATRPPAHQRSHHPSVVVMVVMFLESKDKVNVLNIFAVLSVNDPLGLKSDVRRALYVDGPAATFPRYWLSQAAGSDSSSKKSKFNLRFGVPAIKMLDMYGHDVLIGGRGDKMQLTSIQVTAWSN